jgi:hypothetical protein
MKVRIAPSVGGSVEGNGASHHGYIADRFAAKDEVRSTALMDLIRLHGKCKYCGKKLTDVMLEKTPGVCGSKKCRKTAIEDVKRMRRDR